MFISWSISSLNVSSLSDGSINITADHADSSFNNATQASSSILKIRTFNSWDFSASGDYTFDGNYVEVSSGTANLKTVNLLFNDSNFSLGSFQGGESSGGKLKLIAPATDSITSVNALLPGHSASLVGYWRMDGSFNDGSGSSYHGSGVNGVSTMPYSLFGEESAYFAGNNYVNLDDFSVGNTVSLSLWANPDSNFLSGGHTLIGKHSSSGGNFVVVGCWSGKYHVRIRNSTKSLGDCELGWQHILVVIKDQTTSSLVKFYLNGSLLWSDVFTDRIGTITPGKDWVLGQEWDNSNPSDYYKGYIDDVAIWTTELTAADALNIYESKQKDEVKLSASWTPHWGNLVGYWPIDGNFHDSSSSSHHMTSYNGASVSSIRKVGEGSGSFDGANDYLQKSGLSYTNAVVPEETFMAWVKVLGSSPNLQGIFARMGNNTNPQAQLMLSEDGSNARCNAMVSGTNTAYTGSILKLNEWNHLACTIVVESGKLRISTYLNGKLMSSVLSNTDSTYESVADRLRIGVQKTGGFARYFNGHIDEAAWFSKGFSETEVALVYNRQNSKYAGSYKSPIIDLGTSANINKLIWNTDLPFYKELTATSEDLLDYVSLNSNSLMSGLRGLYHFNETSLDSAPSSLDFLDSSGNGKHGYETDGVTPGASGLFGKALYFDGVDDWARVNNVFATAPDDVSFSFWVKPLENCPQSACGLVSSSNNNNPRITFGTTGSVGVGLHYDGGGWAGGAGSGTTTMRLGEWNHIVITLENLSSAPLINIYMDGELVGSGSRPSAVHSFTSISIGRRDSTRDFNGYMDELALWDRVLSANEAKEVYRRGANRVKVQVRTCADSSCSANEEWHGAANNDKEFYFSELNNCGFYNADGTCNLSSGIVATGLPDYTLSNFTNFVMAPNKYFQFRVNLESDDSSGTPTFPSLNSINFGTKYYGGKPTIITNSGQVYTYLSNFSATTSGACTPKFQLGHNSTSNWYYWNGSNWVSTLNTPANVAHVNDVTSVNANISQFAADVGAGSVYVRAFLDSNTDQDCSINSLSISGY